MIDPKQITNENVFDLDYARAERQAYLAALQRKPSFLSSAWARTVHCLQHVMRRVRICLIHSSLKGHASTVGMKEAL